MSGCFKRVTKECNKGETKNLLQGRKPRLYLYPWKGELLFQTKGLDYVDHRVSHSLRARQ